MKARSNIVEKSWLAYQRKLLLYIQSRVKTPEDAEDIINDVFMKLSNTVNDNTDIENISAWLYRVSKNSIIDYYRTKKNLEPLPDDFFMDSDANGDVNNKEPNIIKELSKCMPPMINALPEAYRQPLLLSEIEGLKYKEVATELGLSISAVKSRILRGREKLHKSLIICCTLYRNDAGETVDYNKKSNNACSGC